MKFGACALLTIVGLLSNHASGDVTKKEIHDALLNVVTARDNKCISYSDCKKCKAAGCGVCDLQSIGQYGLKAKNGLLTQSEIDAAFSKNDINGNIVCGSVRSNCLALKTLADDPSASKVLSGYPTGKKYSSVGANLCGVVETFAAGLMSAVVLLYGAF